MAAEGTEAYTPRDEIERVMTDAFRKIPHHRRGYPDTVVPRLADALKAAGLVHTEPDNKENQA